MALQNDFLHRNQYFSQNISLTVMEKCISINSYVCTCIYVRGGKIATLSGLKKIDIVMNI